MPIPDEFWTMLFDFQHEDILSLMNRLPQKHPLGKEGMLRVAIECWGGYAIEEEETPILRLVDELDKEVDEEIDTLAGMRLPDKKLIAIAANAKEGKTFIALEILRAVSSGEYLFGKYPVKNPGCVVYFDMENGAVEIMGRLRKRGDTGKSLPWYNCHQTFNMDGEEGFTKFNTLIDSLPSKPRLIVIDTLREAFRVPDWNKSEFVIPAFAPYRAWSRKNCTIIVLHHNNKNQFAQGGDRMSGSSAIPGATDGYWLLDPAKKTDNGNRRWRVDVTGRAGMNGEMWLEMDTENFRITEIEQEELQLETDQKRAEHRAHRNQKALAIISDKNGMTAEELADSLACSVQYARRIIKEMMEEGIIKTTSEKRKNPFSDKPSFVYIPSPIISSSFGGNG